MPHRDARDYIPESACLALRNVHRCPSSRNAVAKSWVTLTQTSLRRWQMRECLLYIGLLTGRQQECWALQSVTCTGLPADRKEQICYSCDHLSRRIVNSWHNRHTRSQPVFDFRRLFKPSPPLPYGQLPKRPVAAVRANIEPQIQVDICEAACSMILGTPASENDLSSMLGLTAAQLRAATKSGLHDRMLHTIQRHEGAAARLRPLVAFWDEDEYVQTHVFYELAILGIMAAVECLQAESVKRCGLAIPPRSILFRQGITADWLGRYIHHQDFRKAIRNNVLVGVILLGDSIHASDEKSRCAEGVAALAAKQCGVHVRGAAELDGINTRNDAAGRAFQVGDQPVTFNHPADLLLARSLLAALSQEESATPEERHKWASWYATGFDQLVRNKTYVAPQGQVWGPADPGVYQLTCYALLMVSPEDATTYFNIVEYQNNHTAFFYLCCLLLYDFFP